MRLSRPKTPKERDWEIYQQVFVENRQQGAVAKMYHITQARVSQICKKVRRWQAMNVNEDVDGVPQRNFVNIRESRVRIQAKLRQATDAFEESLKPDVQKTKRTKNGEEYKEIKKKRGKADHQMFRHMCQLEDQLLERQMQENEAEAAVLVANRRWSVWLEEELVRACLLLCRQATHHYPEAVALGMQMPPLPEFHTQQIEAHVRMKQRHMVKLKKGSDPSRLNRLPAEWSAVITHLTEAYEPFRALAPEETTTTPGATSAPLDSQAVGAENKNYEQLYEQEVDCNKRLMKCLMLAEERGCVVDRSKIPEQYKSELSANNAYKAYNSDETAREAVVEKSPLAEERWEEPVEEAKAKEPAKDPEQQPSSPVPKTKPQPKKPASRQLPMVRFRPPEPPPPKPRPRLSLHPPIIISPPGVVHPRVPF